MTKRNIISGTGMAVLLGWISLMCGLFSPYSIEEKFTFIILGIIMIYLGIKFSKG